MDARCCPSRRVVGPAAPGVGPFSRRAEGRGSEPVPLYMPCYHGNAKIYPHGTGLFKKTSYLYTPVTVVNPGDILKETNLFSLNKNSCEMVSETQNKPQKSTLFFLLCTNNLVSNPWRYSSEEPRPTEVVAARWQYKGPCG